MKMSKLVKFTLVSLLTLGLMAYVIYAVFFLSGPYEEGRCSAVALVVEKE